MRWLALVLLAGCGRVGFDEQRDSGSVDVGGDVGVPRVAQIALGTFHTCLLTDRGTVRCWGSGTFGELGYGDTADIGDDETPASKGDVPLGALAVAITAGFGHTCALLEGGNVRCWGVNATGQSGNATARVYGDDEPASEAPDVVLGGRATQISASNGHTCALLEGGSIRCWGNGQFGVLGYGNENHVGDDEPVSAAGDVMLGGAAVAVTTGTEHTCALLEGGKVRCWGDGAVGRLGYGDTNNVGDDETPASKGDVPLPRLVAEITADAQGAHTCVRFVDGSVRCWGQNIAGVLGAASTVDIGDNEPAAAGPDVGLGETAVQIDSGGQHSCALTQLGSVRCWGLNDDGQLGLGHRFSIGDDELPSSISPIDLGGVATQISAGQAHTCAVLATGGVRCWGDNSRGQLGYGKFEDIGDDETPAVEGDVPVE